MNKMAVKYYLHKGWGDIVLYRTIENGETASSYETDRYLRTTNADKFDFKRHPLLILTIRKTPRSGEYHPKWEPTIWTGKDIKTLFIPISEEKATLMILNREQ